MPSALGSGMELLEELELTPLGDLPRKRAGKEEEPPLKRRLKRAVRRHDADALQELLLEDARPPLEARARSPSRGGAVVLDTNGLLQAPGFPDALLDEPLDARGRTLLILAAIENAEEVARRLLSMGADASLRDAEQLSALDWAARQGSYEVLRVLCPHVRVDAFAGVRGELSPLLLVKDERAARILLSAKARVNLRTAARGQVRTPLIEAVKRAGERGPDGFPAQGTRDGRDLVRLLMEAHADCALKYEFGWTALHHACFIGSRSTLRLLLSPEGMRHVNETTQPNGVGPTPLVIAVVFGHKELVSILLDHHADADFALKQGSWDVGASQQPIFDLSGMANAICSARIVSEELRGDIVAELLTYKASPNASTPNGRCPLAMAARHRREQCVELLLRHGAKARNLTLEPSAQAFIDGKLSDETPLHPESTAGSPTATCSEKERLSPLKKPAPPRSRFNAADGHDPLSLSDASRGGVRKKPQG